MRVLSALSRFVKNGTETGAPPPTLYETLEAVRMLTAVAGVALASEPRKSVSAPLMNLKVIYGLGSQEEDSRFFRVQTCAAADTPNNMAVKDTKMDLSLLIHI